MEPFLNLSIGARKRLDWLRSHARDKGIDWRAMRDYGFHNWHSAYCALSNGRQSDGTPIWYCHTGEYFKRERFVDECRNNVDRPRVDHHGWFTDPDCGEVCRGIVVQLSRGRYIAGYYWSMNGERVYFPEVFDSESDAAYSADNRARVYAEAEREYQERFHEAERLRDRIEDQLKRLRECIRLRHDSCLAYAREEIPDLLMKIRLDREILRTEFADVE